VRRALDEGYDVRCIVRPRQNPADFLRDWGAVTVKADLTKPDTLPPALVGIHTIIDCATARPEESIKQVDWEGKKALIRRPRRWASSATSFSPSMAATSTPRCR